MQRREATRLIWQCHCYINSTALQLKEMLVFFSLFLCIQMACEMMSRAYFASLIRLEIIIGDWVCTFINPFLFCFPSFLASTDTLTTLQCQCSFIVIRFNLVVCVVAANKKVFKSLWFMIVCARDQNEINYSSVDCNIHTKATRIHSTHCHFTSLHLIHVAIVAAIQTSGKNGRLPLKSDTQSHLFRNAHA